MTQPPAFYLAAALAIGCNGVHLTRTFAAPQDSDPAAEQADDDSKEHYIITLSEYSLKDIDPSTVTSEAIVSAIKTQKAAPLETVMLSAIAGNESKVNFGRTINVTTGRITTRDGTTRQTNQMSVGTILT